MRAWGYYSVAAVATGAACLLWLVVLNQPRAVSPVVSVGLPVGSPVTVAPSVSFSSPVPPPLQLACMAGVVWAYDVSRRVWFKLSPETRCDVGDVQSVRQRGGFVVHPPKPGPGVVVRCGDCGCKDGVVRFR